MELEFHFDLYNEPPLRPIQEEVGWALLELSLEDPDYETVSRELKQIHASLSTPRSCQKKLNIRFWN